jgi:hypothetical protein
MRKIKVYLNHDLVCPNHAARGPLPCPWPNCKNGIAEKEFEEENFLSGLLKSNSHRKVFHTRRKWKSPFGTTYYSWDNSELPNWFGVTNTFWREIERQKVFSDYLPDIIYHYSSLEGFLGIVKNKSIWMSDYSYLNDSRELMYGIDVVSSAIEEISKTKLKKTSMELLRNLADSTKNFRNRVCISSFSVDGDSLGQWRAYGPIAIGFSTTCVALHVNQAMTRPVVYNAETQLKMTMIYINHICQSYEADMRLKRLDRIPDVYNKADRIIELIVFFKDPAFKSEKEYRLAYVDNHETLEALGIRSPPKSFRVSRGKIVPYVASTDVLPSEGPDLALEIKEIVVGPEADNLLERGIREFLDSEGLSNVSIRRSTVPLRS